MECGGGAAWGSRGRGSVFKGGGGAVAWGRGQGGGGRRSPARTRRRHGAGKAAAARAGLAWLGFGPVGRGEIFFLNNSAEQKINSRKRNKNLKIPKQIFTV